MPYNWIQHGLRTKKYCSDEGLCARRANWCACYSQTQYQWESLSAKPVSRSSTQRFWRRKTASIPASHCQKAARFHCQQTWVGNWQCHCYQWWRWVVTHGNSHFCRNIRHYCCRSTHVHSLSGSCRCPWLYHDLVWTWCELGTAWKLRQAAQSSKGEIKFPGKSPCTFRHVNTHKGYCGSGKLIWRSIIIGWSLYWFCWSWYCLPIRTTHRGSWQHSDSALL